MGVLKPASDLWLVACGSTTIHHFALPSRLTYLPHPTSYIPINNPPPACGHLPRRGRQKQARDVWLMARWDTAMRQRARRTRFELPNTYYVLRTALHPHLLHPIQPRRSLANQESGKYY